MFICVVVVLVICAHGFEILTFKGPSRRRKAGEYEGFSRRNVKLAQPFSGLMGILMEREGRISTEV